MAKHYFTPAEMTSLHRNRIKDLRNERKRLPKEVNMTLQTTDLRNLNSSPCLCCFLWNVNMQLCIKRTFTR